MDFIALLSGHILLEFLGASIRFLYLNLACLLNENDFTTFSSIWSPTGSTKKREENSSLNQMIGVVSFGVIIFLLIIFNA